MTWLQQFDLRHFLLFTLVLTRVSGLTMTAPIYGTAEVPMQVRALLAMALALLITPTQWGTAVAEPGSILQYLVILGSELLVGLCLGLGVLLLFSGIQLAGEMIGRVSGVMLSDVFDPSLDTEVPTLSRLLFLVALAVFVGIGGHRMVMAGLLDTFATIPPGRFPPWQVPAFQTPPPGSGLLGGSLAETFTVLLTQSFSLGIRAAAPTLTAVLLATLVLALISRTLPQLNILMVGFGLNSMLTYAVMALTLGGAAWIFQDEVGTVINTLLTALHAAGAGRG